MTVTCESCGTPFVAVRGGQRACKPSCAAALRNGVPEAERSLFGGDVERARARWHRIAVLEDKLHIVGDGDIDDEVELAGLLAQGDSP